MRYSEDHKAQTHQRIINEASARFRRDGIGATGLQPLMKSLGLTHGGFYAHFKSKDELVEKSLRQAADSLSAHCNALFEKADNPLAAFVDHYLSAAHRASPAEGCPLPTMSAELGQRGQASMITDEVIRNRLKSIQRGLSVAHTNAPELSTVMLSALVGALVLSRSALDPELSDRILEDTREWLKQQTKS
ncbi:TetR/AcrR family transcriptional regulator [Pseudomonas sp. CCC3.2]|uniref:TetR/AcrR family transcriptional regulator n=1 Tax=unclassified Pseudomonas TaxID=196821 RepID=UPI002AB3C62D|nr:MULTISPECIES: TetR/AcrR family transcriptional regulator [unclassified Pseudomonas]MDY7561384.1 TetR/AcrR family transcriptional regulator [Pseudomonas sp. AB6]MEB0182671.1 TetR/AcrR family transcriptional regulator [Pseudomonas sp. CCC3.2]MEB0213395.1 TetR/AcrR family transcriptional regulator [Pseudomonas sp. AB6]